MDRIYPKFGIYNHLFRESTRLTQKFVGVLESSPVKHGSLGLILSWVIPNTLKRVSAAFLALKLSI